jgi:hypothetical protein
MAGILTSSNSSTPTVYKCEVTNVNVKTFTIDAVEVPDRSKHFIEMTYGVPYLNSRHGGGMHFMPEVGSTCYVMTTSTKGEQAVVICFVGPELDENDKKKNGVDRSQRGNRPDMNPGDLYLGTVDGNEVFVRRGGVIDIKCTDVCRRLYIPVNNVIKDFCQNYQLETMAGKLKFSVQRIQEPTGKLPCTLRIEAKEMASDGKGAMIMVAGGKSTLNPTGGLSVYVMPSGWGATQKGSSPDVAGQEICFIGMDQAGMVKVKATTLSFEATTLQIAATTLALTGELSVTGSSKLTGDVTITGNLTVNGECKVTWLTTSLSGLKSGKKRVAFHDELKALCDKYNGHTNGGAGLDGGQQVTGLSEGANILGGT